SLEFLASDELKGRATGSAEMDVAAEYIANEFRSLGLRIDLIDGGPFQLYDVQSQATLGDPAENAFRLTQEGAETTEETGGQDSESPQLNEDFVPLALGGNGTVDLPVVFVGYGITAPDLNYDDYASVDVKGKAVLMLRKEPQQSDAESIFNGAAPSEHAYFTTKMENAVKHGAAAVIMVNDRQESQREHNSTKRRWQRQLDALTKLHAGFNAKESPTDEEFEAYRQEILKRTKQLESLDQRFQNADKILGHLGAGTDLISAEVPAFFCRRNLFREAIQSVADRSLDSIEEAIDKELSPQSFELTGWRVVAQAKIHRQPLQGKNVIAVLEGHGDLADETLILGAHYDHVGMGGQGSLAPWTTAVHNGADDNASGVTSLLEVARRFAAQEKRPARRIVFMAFSGEELGLLGSAHYVRNPRFALEKTVAMLNLDMVGRLRENPLEVHGVGTAAEFGPLLDSFAKQVGIQLTTVPGGNGPSDHASFNGQQIPVLHFFTGLHSDYHRPSDDVERIDVNGLAKITDLFYLTAEAVANAGQRFGYVVSEDAKQRTRPNRPVLGIVLGDVTEQGVAVASVAEDGPAAAAGMLAGDVISKVDDTPIRSQADLLGILDAAQVDQEVEVFLLREESEQSLKVKLGPSR
ncbi:MAG: M20/M25/M40 family metallo-hydrolase, partial [Planctomycetales bacterium]|nr:M20/M25/M40 family metallo-hydrolase [Planctomycetales bacterium]